MRDKKALAERLFSAAGLAVGGGILAYLLWYVRCRVDLGRVLGAVRPGWLLAAAACVPLCELIDAWIFRWMGRRAGADVGWRGCLDAVVIGEFYYKLGPPGAPVQLKLMLDAGMSGPVAAGVYTWKMTANTVCYTAYAVAALALKLLVFNEDLGWAVWGAGALIAVYVLLCAGVLLVAARPEGVQRGAARLLRVLGGRIRPLGEKGRVELILDKLGQFCARLRALRGDGRMLAGLFSAMLLELGVLFSIPACLYFGLGLSGHGAVELVLTQCLVMVLSRIVLLPGNAGGAEGSFYLFMAPVFGEALPVALVLWRCAAFLEVMLLGGVWSVARFARGAVGRRK